MCVKINRDLRKTNVYAYIIHVRVWNRYNVTHNLLQFEKNVVPAVCITVGVFEAPTAHTNQVNN